MKKIVSLLCVVCILLQSSIIVRAEAKLELSAKSVVLMEASTGELLYNNNKDEQLPIASVTKIMTMLLIMESLDSGKIQIDEMVTSSELAKSMGGSTMFLETGEQLSVHDMLKGIAVASANDGSVAMAEHISGSVESFVDLMNSRANELGMENTHFINTNGLDAEGHYSSAYDVAIMSRELIKHEKIFEYTTIWMDTLRDGKFQLANTNKLIRFYSGANGLKTGSTSKALCCLAATAKRNDMQLIAVVLGAPNSKDRFSAGSKLLDYGFANYSIKNVVEKNEMMGVAPVLKGVENQVAGVAKDGYTLLTNKGDKSEIEKNILFDEEISAPIEFGQRLGIIELIKDNEVVGTVEIVSDCDIAKKGFTIWVIDIIKKWVGN